MDCFTPISFGENKTPCPSNRSAPVRSIMILDAVVTAVNGFLDRKTALVADPHLGDKGKGRRFLQRIMETVERGVQANSLSGLAALLQTSPPGAPSQDTSAVKEDLETALDFVNSM